MIEITLADVGTVFGVLGSVRCVANLLWGLFRNDAVRVLIYGIAVFASIVIALNVGGVVNEESWALFGVAVFGLHSIYSAVTGQAAWKTLLFLALACGSLFTLMGVWR